MKIRQKNVNKIATAKKLKQTATFYTTWGQNKGFFSH